MRFDTEVAHELLASLELVLETTATLHGQVEAMLDAQAQEQEPVRKTLTEEHNDMFAALWKRLDAEEKQRKAEAELAPVPLPMAQPQEAEPEPEPEPAARPKLGAMELPEIRGKQDGNVFYFEQDSYDAIAEYIKTRHRTITSNWRLSNGLAYLYQRIPDANVFSFDKVDYADLKFGISGRNKSDKVSTYTVLPNGVAYVFSKHLDAKAFEFMVARLQDLDYSFQSRHHWCDTLLADGSIRKARVRTVPESVSEWTRHSFASNCVQDHAVMQPLKDARVIYHVDWTFQTVPSFYN